MQCFMIKIPLIYGKDCVVPFSPKKDILLKSLLTTVTLWAPTNYFHSVSLDWIGAIMFT